MRGSRGGDWSPDPEVCVWGGGGGGDAILIYLFIRMLGFRFFFLKKEYLGCMNNIVVI